MGRTEVSADSPEPEPVDQAARADALSRLLTDRTRALTVALGERDEAREELARLRSIAEDVDTDYGSTNCDNEGRCDCSAARLYRYLHPSTDTED